MYKREDRGQLIRVINVVCSESKWMISNKFILTPEWECALQISNCNDYLILVVEDENILVGWCRIFLLFNSFSIKIGELGIGLLPKYRGQYIGAKMIEQSLSWSKNKDFIQVHLSVHQENYSAQQLFRKFKFKTYDCHGENNLMSLAL